MKKKFPGAVQWLVFEDFELLELVIKAMHELRIPELRTAFSWADWERPGGREWFDHFIGRLREERIKIVPCLFYTPPEKARRKPGAAEGEEKTSYPPRRLEDYVDFTAEMIGRYGDLFEWIQFWNEPNWDVYWNWEMDPGWKLFAEMVGGAIAVAKKKQKKIVLGGLSPYEPEWVDAMFGYGILQHADALGVHAFPGTWDMEEAPRRKGRPWESVASEVEDVREQLRGYGSRAEVWFTETGYSTYGTGAGKEEREKQQIKYFNELLSCHADRVFWHTIVDQKGGTPTDNELTAGLPWDEKAYFFGIMDAKGMPKPLYRHWQKCNFLP